MTKNRSHRPAQLIEAPPAATPQPVVADHSARPTQVTVLWLADPPTWALGRLYHQIPPDAPVIAASGERVVGSNPAARKAGIRPNETLSRALQLCPAAAVYPHDTAAMMAAWDSVIATAYGFSPWVEPVQVGLMFLGGLSSREAHNLAQATHTRAGQAQSRSTAQLAALIAPEGSVRLVSNETAFIAQVPVGYLLWLGFSKALVERLRLFGVDHLADLHRLSLTKKQLEAQFKSEGKRLYQIAHGQFTEPIQRFREPPVARARWEFEEPVVQPHQFMPVLHLLVAHAAMELGQKVCWTVTVAIQYCTHRRLHRRVLGAATNKPKQLLHVAELTFWDAHQGGAEIEALEVTLGRIVLSQAQQQDLFGAFGRHPVQDALERVDSRFNGGIGRMELKKVSRFREEGWGFVPLGPSQQIQVGDGRRLR